MIRKTIVLLLVLSICAATQALFAQEVDVSMVFSPNQVELIKLSDEFVINNFIGPLCQDPAGCNGVSTAIRGSSDPDKDDVVEIVNFLIASGLIKTEEAFTAFRLAASPLTRAVPLPPAVKPQANSILDIYNGSNNKPSMLFNSVVGEDSVIQSVLLNPNSYRPSGPVTSYFNFHFQNQIVGGAGVTSDSIPANALVYATNTTILPSPDNTSFIQLFWEELVHHPQHFSINVHSTDYSPANYTIVRSSRLSSLLPVSQQQGSAGIVTAQHRFLLYRIRKQVGTVAFSQIFLQVLNDSAGTLTLAGPAKPLTGLAKTLQPVAESLQSVAIDPLGSFAVYTLFASSCGKEILKYQKLDPDTGSKIGPAKVLLSCTDVASSTVGVFGIDVLRHS